MTFTKVRNVVLLYLAAIVAGVSFVFAGLALFTGINRNTDRNQDLCGVLYSMIASSGATIGKPGYPGYAYYQDHPDELALARAQNRAFLTQLPCSRAGTPTTPRPRKPSARRPVTNP